MVDSLFILRSDINNFRMNFIYKIREKEITVFLIKMLIFLALVIMLDFSIGSILKYFYFKQKSGLLYRTTYSMDSTRADFLVLGSSTATHHYNSDILEKRLGISVYNAGRNANPIFYDFAVFQSILKRYTPKIVLLDFNVEEFKVNPDDYDKISSLLPYYKDHPEIRSIIRLKSPYENYKLLSKIYPFNSLLFTIGIGSTNFNTNRDDINDVKGYVPLSRVWTKRITTDTSIKEYELDSNKINTLKSFVYECTTFNIQLYIIVSPRFVKYSGSDISIEIARKIAKQSNFSLYDYSKDTIFWEHKEYFADGIHLNNDGATIFSNKVVDTILKSKQYLHIKSKTPFQ
jgi:hypothetical protein